jgi:hypothetical protein
MAGASRHDEEVPELVEAEDPWRWIEALEPVDSALALQVSPKKPRGSAKRG